MFKTTLKSYAVIALGSIISAVAFNWFYGVNRIATGGVTGLAQALNALLPALPIGVAVFCMNVPLFLIGWWKIGFHLLAASAFSMAVNAAAIDAIALVHVFAPTDPMLASVCGGALMGFGWGLVFSQGATTGGSDIVSRLVQLKCPWVPMGKIMLGTDGCILVLVAAVFGDVTAALYGLIALYVGTKVMDTVLYGLNTSKLVYIISDRWEEIARSLMEDLHRGVTILHGEGGYTRSEKQVLMVAIRDKEIVSVRQAVCAADPDAFMIVCAAHDVLGEGFEEYQKEAL